MIHPDLELAKTKIYEPNGFHLQNFKLEDESEEYSAAEFELNQWKIRFRTSKITPTKKGQFTTFWKRIGKGPILPYDIEDAFDFLVVSTRAEDRVGQFIFSKNLLLEKGILSKNSQEGKRAFRVYTPWDHVDNAQARKTQAWQQPCFLEFTSNNYKSCRNFLLA